jgi:GDPmannose 4,6-dehydratase
LFSPTVLPTANLYHGRVSKTALIFGVSGQDGAYLARLLLEKGYDVHGTSRDAELQAFERLRTLGIRERVQTHSASMRDFRELLNLIGELRPDEIYNLAGQSSVGLSFAQPMETMQSITQAQLLLLDVLRTLKLPTRLYNAGSSECFGGTPRGGASDESSPFAPRSPYAAAKAGAYWITATYREAYDLYACSGIVFNHESPLRSERFVVKKIVSAAAAIAAGRSNARLRLGNVSVSRDWGYSAEFVDAMWRMLQQERAADYVIATGESHTVEELAEAAFAEAGLDYREHVEIDPALLRPSDLDYSRGNPDRAARELGWEPKTRFRDLVKLLVEDETTRHSSVY